nr:HEAT repeat domain-containing protein [Trichodesmium sp. MO_231.B1]
PQLQQLFKDEDERVRAAAASAVGNLGSEAKQFIPQLLGLLNDEDSEVREATAKVLGEIGKFNTQQILQILNATHRNTEQEAGLRFLAYFTSGGESKTITLIQWLGSPKRYPDQINNFREERSISREEGNKVLEIFADAWPNTKNLEYLRPELKAQINKVVKKVDWQPEDLTLLNKHYNNLEDEDIKAKIDALQTIE